jgi:hypothetical protein
MLQWKHRYAVVAAFVLLAVLVGFGDPGSSAVGWGW